MKNLPIEEAVYELDKAGSICLSCGGKLKPIGRELVRREMIIIPAQVKLLKYYQQLYLRNRIVPSMSRKGASYDNACAESFFSTIKLEMIYHEHYATKAQAQAAILGYIEGHYNVSENSGSLK